MKINAKNKNMYYKNQSKIKSKQSFLDLRFASSAHE